MLSIKYLPIKKLSLISPVIAFMAACSKKQEIKLFLTPKNATTKDLAGNWTESVDSDFTTNGQIITSVSGNSIGSRFHFNSNNTGSFGTDSKQITKFNYTVSGGVITIITPATSNIQEEEIDLSIISITANRLVVRSYPGTALDDIIFIKN